MSDRKFIDYVIALREYGLQRAFNEGYLYELYAYAKEYMDGVTISEFEATIKELYLHFEPVFRDICSASAPFFNGFDDFPKYKTACQRWIDIHLIHTSEIDCPLDEIYGMYKIMCYENRWIVNTKQIFKYELLRSKFMCHGSMIKDAKLREP